MIMVPGHVAEVATTRRFVAETLSDHPQVDTAVLLVSEAVTNAVIHAQSTTVTVAVAETPDGLRFEVTDDGGGTLPVVREGSDLRESGRGVFLIRELSSRCGFRAREDGLTCWFELPATP